MISIRQPVLIARCVALSAMALLLSACGDGRDDLEQYIDEVKARPGKRPDALPEVKPYETFVYRADETGVRSPFRPDAPTATVGSGKGPRPDDTRAREFLEQYPLDSLAMVGTLQLGPNNFALVQTADGLVHRVLPGNYMGQNYGRVTAITESEISLMEIVSDGIGGFLEREAAISLAD